MVQAQHIPSVNDLMAVMQFTQSDLNANRNGNLSKSQALQLKRTRRRNLAMGALLFFLFVFLATLLIFLGQMNQNIILSTIGGLLTVVNAIMIGMFARSYLRITADLQDGNIDRLSGELERILRRGYQQNNYLLRINGVSIYVTKDIFKQFRHEASYHIYRTTHAHILLSAEPSLD